MKLNKKIIVIPLLIIGIICLLTTTYFLTKFKNADVELGSGITSKDFVRYGMDKNITIDLDKVSKDKVGVYDVKLKYAFIDYDLKVNINDTTVPLLKVKNVYKPLGYEINVDDFVLDVSDFSEVKLSLKNNPEITDYGDYKITIVAEDAYHNIKEEDCILSIGWAKKEFTVEVGNIIKKEDLLYDIKNKDTINQDDIDKINNEREGIYYIKSTLGNDTLDIKIEKTKDVTPPELVLKNLTIYEGRKINSVNDFIKKVSDKGSKVSINLLTNIDYKKIGEQKIEIEASDIDQNKTVKEAILKIIKDTAGPKISNLSKITIDKGKKIDYKKGVSAYDDNFGKCEFTVDSSGVNTSKYGTYYAIYTSSDKIGNKTTSKRVIVVNHDKNDTNDLVKSVANTLSSDAESIRDYVRSTIKYNTNNGGADPVWYGLKNKLGNCIVHAYVFDAILKLKGYNTKIIWTTDKTHYWNMVYLNGKWVHMDSTPSSRHNKYSIMNDELRYERLQGRDWDRTLWPKAE